MAKEFQKKYMHPTRRKLVDMVNTGEYQKDTRISLSDIKPEELKRNVGDIWEENGVIWEQREYGKVKQSKASSELAKLRQFIQKSSECKSTECDKRKYGPTDKQLIKKVGFCSKCLAKKEAVIKTDGLWEAYTEYKIYSNMAAYGTDVLEKWNEALSEITNIHEYISDDGSVEKWTSNEDVQTLKLQIETDIENGKKELIEVIEKRNSAYELLKEKNYDLVQPL
jgi:uncharacterized protein YqgV (UPF0045/DUF77 family)